MAAMAATTQASVNARERRRVAGDSATAAAAARPITASTRISAPHAGHAAASCARVSGRASSVTAPLTTSAPATAAYTPHGTRSEEHTSELQSPCNLVCRLLLEKKKKTGPPIRLLPQRANRKTAIY